MLNLKSDLTNGSEYTVAVKRVSIQHGFKDLRRYVIRNSIQRLNSRKAKSITQPLDFPKIFQPQVQPMDFFPKILNFFVPFINVGQKSQTFDLADFFHQDFKIHRHFIRIYLDYIRNFASLNLYYRTIFSHVNKVKKHTIKYKQKQVGKLTPSSSLSAVRMKYEAQTKNTI